MCIAILNTPQGKDLTKENFKNAWNANSDGAGLMYAKDGKIEIFKEMKSYKTFFAIYKEARRHNTNIVIHFRYATAGAINLDNAHPFTVHPNLAFVHNGVIDIESSKKRSDTSHFNSEVLQKLKPDFLNCDGTVKLISNFVRGSKLVFLDSEGTATIINSNLGYYEDGNWYSNRSHETQIYSFNYAKSKYAYNWESKTNPYNFDTKPTKTTKDWEKKQFEYTEFCDSCLIEITEEEMFETGGYSCYNCYIDDERHSQLNRHLFDE